jgi:hypothetical protein
LSTVRYRYHDNQDGQAVYFKVWKINGKRHRKDGPAVLFDDNVHLYYVYSIYFVLTSDYKQTLLLIQYVTQYAR